MNRDPIVRRLEDPRFQGDRRRKLLEKFSKQSGRPMEAEFEELYIPTLRENARPMLGPNRILQYLSNRSI